MDDGATHGVDWQDAYRAMETESRYVPAIEAALDDLRRATARGDDVTAKLRAAAWARCTPDEVADALGIRARSSAGCRA